MPHKLKKHEKFHVIIFLLVFVYFAILKLTNHIQITWLALLFPIMLGIVLFYGIKYVTKKAKFKQ